MQWPYHIGDATNGPDRLGLICGFLGCDVRLFNPPVAALSRTMVVSNRSRTDGWLGQLTRLAVAETFMHFVGRHRCNTSRSGACS